MANFPASVTVNFFKLVSIGLLFDSRSEMYMGSNFLTQPDPTQYPTDPTQPDPRILGWTRPDPTQVADLGYYFVFKLR